MKAENRTRKRSKAEIDPTYIKKFFLFFFCCCTYSNPSTPAIPRRSMFGLTKEHSVALEPFSRANRRLSTMKSEIVVELLKIMLRKFIKTKIIVSQNVNFIFNLLNSYDGSRRRRDRSKRSHHRQSPEPDTKQQRRHRKPHNADKTEAVRAKVSTMITSCLFGVYGSTCGGLQELNWESSLNWSSCNPILAKPWTKLLQVRNQF